jgi:hypothetical protein
MKGMVYETIFHDIDLKIAGSQPFFGQRLKNKNIPLAGAAVDSFRPGAMPSRLV